MSAFMMDDESLIALAIEAARDYGGRVDPQAARDALWDLHAGNVASLKARYPRNWEIMISPLPALTDAMVSRAKVYPPLAIVKAARCYDYQACEVATEACPYEGTRAFEVSHRAMLRAIDRLPGYADAPRIGR